MLQRNFFQKSDEHFSGLLLRLLPFDCEKAGEMLPKCYPSGAAAMRGKQNSYVNRQYTLI